MEKKLYLSSSPHIHSGETTNKVMRDVILALLPACGVSVYYFGQPALLVLLVCTLGCMVTELLCRKMMKGGGTLGDGSAALTGILLALNLPPSIPLWIAFLGSVIAIAIGKQVYGGLGYNPFNPALVARVVLLIAYPVQMTTWTIGRGVDAVSAATPLGELKNAVMLTGKFPRYLSDDTTEFFIGNVGGSLGEISAVALLIGGAYLFYKKIITWHIPGAFIGSAMLFSWIFWLIDPAHYPSPVFHFCTGGLILGALFMATDMVTSPVTPWGMVVFGIGCGLITVLIRLFGGYPEGVSFAILLMNAATPLIDRYTRPKKFGLAPYRGTL